MFDMTDCVQNAAHGSSPETAMCELEFMFPSTVQGVTIQPALLTPRVQLSSRMLYVMVRSHCRCRLRKPWFGLYGVKILFHSVICMLRN